VGRLTYILGLGVGSGQLGKFPAGSAEKSGWVGSELGKFPAGSAEKSGWVASPTPYISGRL
jgi:hypothetical protein